MLRSGLLRVRTPATSSIIPRCAAKHPVARIAANRVPAMSTQQPPARQNHAISSPTLANIEKRWEEMPPQEQADLWMALRDRMKVDWHEMTLQEKKAAYWIAFGPHGPRALPPPGENWEVFKLVMKCLAASVVLFALTRYFARPPPKTMTREWQEKSNEYLKGQRAEPFTGYAAADYTGKGMIQSRSSKE